MSTGNPDGNCTDCNQPVWWQDNDLVAQDGNRWCFGPNRSRISMERHHALPGMAQWVVQSPNGQVCHCLDRKDPHVHLIADPPVEGAVSDREALDNIALMLRSHAGAGHLLAIARLVKKTGRDTGWNL